MNTKTENEPLIEFKKPSELVSEYEEAEKVLLDILGSKYLVKSILDPFDYALKLKTGEVIRYHVAAVINKEWIHLCILSNNEQPDENKIPYKAERGMDVRVSEIVWVMDAPEGS